MLNYGVLVNTCAISKLWIMESFLEYEPVVKPGDKLYFIEQTRRLICLDCATLTTHTEDTEVSRLAVNKKEAPLVYFKEDDEGRAEVYKNKIPIGKSDQAKDANFTSVGHEGDCILLAGFNSKNEEQWHIVFQYMNTQGKVLSSLSRQMDEAYDGIPLCIRMFPAGPKQLGALVMRCARDIDILLVRAKKLAYVKKIKLDEEAFNCGAVVKRIEGQTVILVANDTSISKIVF